MYRFTASGFSGGFSLAMRLAMYARVLGQSRARVMTMVWSAWLSCRSP